MDESALRTLLNNLDASRSSWHGLLHVFTLLVIFGLAFDLFVIIQEFWADRKEFRYGQVHPHEIPRPKRPSVLLLVLGLIGTALIVIGVSGELYVDVKVEKVETDIRSANNALYLLLSKEAGNAADAAERAKKAGDDVATTAKELAERLSRLRTEAGARRLSAEQQVSLRKALETMPTPIAIGRDPLESEAVDFASDFVDVMNSAKWPVAMVNWLPNGKYGVFIGFTDKEGFDTPQFKLLRDALKQSHCPAVPLLLKVGDRSFSPPAESHVMYLLVATHPPVSAKVR